MQPQALRTTFIRICALFAILPVAVGFTTPALSQSAGQAKIANATASECKTISVGGPTSWQPVSYIASDGRQIGVGIEIIEEYAKRNNLDVKVDIDMPWARTLDLLLQGQIDVTAGGYFKTERQQIYKYSAPYFDDDIMVFQHVDRRFGYSQITDLKGYIGARPHGGSLGNEIDAYSREQLDIVYSPTDDRIFELLMAGHVDYVLLGRYDGLATLGKLGIQDSIIAVEPPVARNPVHLMFSRKSPCLEHVERINQLIAELGDRGILQERIEYHLSQTLFDTDTGS
jgi:polar amino acid transport system substrate-binding protein